MIERVTPDSHPSPDARSHRRSVPALRYMRRAGRGRREAGVTLVEFALIFPIFMVVLFAMIEFGFAFNAVLGINRASQMAALLAGQAGNDAAADCMILNRIEDQLQTPIDKRDIVDIQIMRTGTTGSTILATNVYVRSGTKDCGTYTVPYTASSTGYPEDQRCNILAGCPSLTPARSTVDKIGVQIKYRHAWVTPMRELLRFMGGDGAAGANWTFQKRNVSRMEPVQ